MIPIVAVGGFFAWMIALSPVGKAFSERIRHGALPPGGAAGSEAVLAALEDLRRGGAGPGGRGRWGEEAEPGRVAGLEQEVTRPPGELSEVAERLDFAGLMLAERGEPK